MTIKSILLSAIASGLYWAALGQTDLTHAELTYVETTSFVNKADKQIIRTVQHIYHLSPDFLKTTQYMNKNMTYTYLHDLNKRQTTVYLNNGEKFYRTTEKYAPIVFNIGKYRLHKPSVQLLGDTLTIAGYACKKALLTFSIEGKQATMQMWYCPDIRLATHLVDYPFTELPGIPVKFSFISKPEMSFETADIDVDCQFVLQNLNPRPNGNVVVENSERYVAMDESQKGNIIFEMMLAPSPGPIKSNRGKAITETLQGKDGITVSTIRYTPFSVGDTIAPFEGMDVHLQKVSHQHYADRLLVINFWFTRCGPCIQEMPYLNKVQALYKNKPVSFISITYDNKNEVEDFLAKRPFTFRPIVDAQHLIDQFNVSTYPLTIIVDKNRVVRFVKVGELKKGLEKTIDRLL